MVLLSVLEGIIFLKVLQKLWFGGAISNCIFGKLSYKKFVLCLLIEIETRVVRENGQVFTIFDHTN